MTVDPTTAPEPCVVCGEAADPGLSAECNWCDGRYHLNQRNDIEAKDCGQVWIDEQFLALQFACNTCLAGDGAPSTKSGPTPSRRR
jgi:hypothetical protein